MVMLLKNITIKTFRNIMDARVNFGDRFNIIYGDNGQGKTNLLEAIFFLGTVKSFRHVKNKDLVTWCQPAANLQCTLTDNRLQHELHIAFDGHGKQLKVDGKHVTKIAEYSNVFSVVAFSPEELRMISGIPEQRRRYLDRAIFSSSPEYLTLYYSYFRALKQRNQLLKQRNYAGIEAWTDQLATTGSRLVAARSRYIKELAELVQRYYKDISGSDEEGRLCYHAHSLSDPCDQQEISEQLRSIWTENSRFERERGMTLKGPHRDDLDFLLNGRPIREHGSQGQQKSFVIALKMAEVEYLEKLSGRLPILLLDDVTAELDNNRTMHLMDFMANRKMQVFMTTTDPATVPLAQELESCSFRVENGRFV